MRGLLAAASASYSASAVAPSAPTMTELTAAAESTTTLDNLRTSYEPPVPTAIGGPGAAVDDPRKSKVTAAVIEGSSGNGGAEEKARDATRAAGAVTSKRTYI
jgi:hypothetical protein